MKIDTRITEMDMKILKKQEEVGSDVSSTQLGEMLGIPGRTVRYRLNRLKDLDILHPPTVHTHERRLGLGECTILLQTKPNKDATIQKILDEIPSFYWNAPTYGQYEGIVSYCLYPLSNPRMIPELAEVMKHNQLIDRYYFIDIVDYHREAVDIFSLSSENSWTWEKWGKEAKRILEEGEEIDLDFDMSPQVMSFDQKDVQILKMKVKDANITLKEIGDALNLSQPQVHNRLKNLEQSGTIRGYKPHLRPFDSMTMIGIFLRSADRINSILLALHKLPLFHDIAIESQNHYYVRIGVPTAEISKFLSAIRPLRQASDEFLVQLILSGTSVQYGSLMDTFSSENGKWSLPMDEYLAIIEEFS
jgi:DNA-binding Lrp family transcriptional regulator